MSFNTFGRVFRFSTWGESHGPGLGAVVDGCPPGLALTEKAIQPFLDARRPGQSKYTTQRKEADQVRILSGVFDNEKGQQVTTGTPIHLMRISTARSVELITQAKADGLPITASTTWLH
ncbi:MAG: chorismate synthase, partial [Pseudomonadota bacterium]